MAKLKVFVASIGFFELAVAVPSKKAAMEAFGLNQTAFNHGFVKPTDDKEIARAVLAKPGTVLKRAVGSSTDFRERSELPKIKSNKRMAKPAPARPALKIAAAPAREGPDNRKALKLKAAAEKIAARLAAKQKIRAEEAAEEEQKAQKTLEAAEARYGKKREALIRQRNAVDALLEKEQRRWETERKKLIGGS